MYISKYISNVHTNSNLFFLLSSHNINMDISLPDCHYQSNNDEGGMYAENELAPLQL